MNLGKGFSVPQEKQIVQNGHFWVPVTPEKQVVQRPNYPPAQNKQNEAGPENWQDLLGIYSGLLQDNTSNMPSQKFNPIENCSMPTQNFSSTGLIAPNCREYSSIPPRKVDSLADLMGMKSSGNAPLIIQEPIRSNLVMVSPANICPQFQVESARIYKSASAILQQNRALHTNQENGGDDLQQMPNGRLSVPHLPIYNLNLPPRLEAGESSNAAWPFQLGLVTPDQQKKSSNYDIIQMPQLYIDQVPNQEKDMWGDCILSQESEIVGRMQNEAMQNTLGTSSAALPTSAKEMNVLDGGNEGGIDLNKTPPTKPPKRRKHRPKVVVEGKPKRTPKPPDTKNKTPKRTPKLAEEKNNTPEGTSTGKRKYVRRKGINTSTTPTTDVANEVEESHDESASKSCRRSLNFDFENGVEKESQGREFEHQAQNTEGSKLPLDLNLNLGSHDAEWAAELNEPSTSMLKEGKLNIYDEEKQQTQEDLYEIVHSAKQILQDSLPFTAPTPAPKNHTLNFIARSLSAQNGNLKQSGVQISNDQIHLRLSEKIVQNVIQANTNGSNIDGRKQPILYTKPHLLEKLVNTTEIRGYSREHSHSEPKQPQSVNLMGSQLWVNKVSGMDHYASHSGNVVKNGPESIRKSRVEDKFHMTSSSMTSGLATVEDCLGPIESSRNKRFYAQSSTLNLTGTLPNSGSKEKWSSSNPDNEANKLTCDWLMNSTDFGRKLQHQKTSYQVHQCAEKLEPKSHLVNKSQTTVSLATVTDLNHASSSQRDQKLTQGKEKLDSLVHVSVRRLAAKVASRSKVTSTNSLPQQETKSSRGYKHSSKKVKGSKVDKRMLFSVDYITDLMKSLRINNSGKEICREEQSAIVPYRGDGAMVAYEAFEPIKKRQQRPKVDLDPESNRLWNLLMGKEGSESTQAMDSDKEKWWEEERKVFRGRVDSFIARMHLVQGDRRFSKWKGSVVDSVIGVFLTQNVSDHLSSSAFMSLAAKFPLKSTTMRPPYCQTGESPSTEQQFFRVTFPDGTTAYDQQMKSNPTCIFSSVTSSELTEFGSENANTRPGTNLTNGDTRRTEEEMISSQNSSESFIFQASEDIRSSSGSNSEAEDHAIGLDLNQAQVLLSLPERAERVSPFQQHQFEVMGSSFPQNTCHQQLGKPVQYPGLASSRNDYSYPFTLGVAQYQSSAPSSTKSLLSTSTDLEKWEADILANSGKECLSSLASMDFGIANGKNVEYRHDNAGKRAETSYTSQQTGRPEFQQAMVHHGSSGRNGIHFIDMWQGGVQETFQQESTSLADPTRPVKALMKQPTDNPEQTRHVTLEPNEIPQVDSSTAASSKIGTTTSNARKRKAEKEKVEPFNWDTLRTEVESKYGTRGINPNTMDSLDYEAIRKANVREISDTIKERGMNNMLAERMKDFLDRLVQDHGKIDLEWLRDVQPDKAKDYLLSIWGLGLKSVECVRLLTLHHLAFPVDTNVGRIAVRLGWVPLQPLPESLQLHLLELYPMLETIQKYLWPRLCKLDQETLYELHYQMITFGKVFCTKREPNCNACPMRGECRHFASAFASARLALPGPEEKRIVTSATPPSARKIPDVILKPVPLLPAGDDLARETRFTGNCEPIIEEPTTPEAPVEVSERDIEDAFYEDPDEIPVINLNIEEFTTNLQSFMQENMELQEGDMSKALVALSPALASIPVPKLKNVSRLRTEHQVYELPDSHPLLKGLDRREPDDPSPYLLAIWTPGETADSVQPPESNCSSQERGGVCNKKTCFSCNSTREADAQTVRGTFLIPCRTAMRGSFPLNGTYFQVNEVFADHASSINPIDVPRNLLWNLPRRTVFFGTSVSTIFKGLSTEDIQFCFWKGFVCVRGFERETRAPRPLRARLHYPASKVTKQNEKK